MSTECQKENNPTHNRKFTYIKGMKIEDLGKILEMIDMKINEICYNSLDDGLKKYFKKIK